ncbi:hypothetical protein PHYPSEUDO_002232 [Phytophthora pseudosyringae]|uniref:AMP-dependent synthetase/ligase domain-containing protein n=1 Tax=Phytophthora pseudosyringae TaxID=221518 RepID=A0A8T1VXQ5_9STRA|nr:hypothetical protein PHYPSEUDO_002232 [Phytophthora pseudosyringae]
MASGSHTPGSSTTIPVDSSREHSSFSGCINVLGENCPEWLFTYMGAIVAGAVIAGMYSTSNAESCQYVSAHCEAKVVVVSDKMQLDKKKNLSVLDQLPALKVLVVWGEADVPRDAKHSAPSTRSASSFNLATVLI